MSDLSSPPLSLIALEGDTATRPPGFDWPAPRGAGAQAAALPEPCEIEGINGKTLRGLLSAFDRDAGLVMVQLPPARGAVPLRFNQFRKLCLTRPLPAAGLTTAAVVEVRLRYRHGAAAVLRSVDPQQLPCGLFVFVPGDEPGQLQRGFVPREAFDSVEFGERGEPCEALPPLPTPPPGEAPSASDERERRIAEIMLARQVLTAEDLERAVAEQARLPLVRIGEALVALGIIDQQQLASALAQQREDRSVPLGELLVRRGLVTRTDLQSALARKMGYPLVDVAQFAAETEALSRLPYAVASRVAALPLLLRGGRLFVAVEDPTNAEVIDDIEFAAQAKAVPVLARASVLPAAINKAYERIGVNIGSALAAVHGGAPVEFDAEEAGKLLASLELQPQPETTDREDSPIEQSDNSLVRLINSMIVEAQAQGVSDIHVECQPGREKVRIRFRKDGVLRPYMELPHNYRSAMIARIKIMCDLDISERRKPQDGKINFGKFVAGAQLELRVATIPTANGLEDAVLRLLASARPIPLDNLGLSAANLPLLRAAAERPYGMLLCVGPTGSGKTTTLHSVLGHINRPERKIWTAEDPVEITQSGMRQVQINARIDWTFAKALRAFLRADPDVIMIGEIRDAETAQMAVEASLTGHLVMSTLHTNSAAETVTRLLDMGMDPFNFADSLLGVLAQRLVRRLCTHCRQERAATPQEVDELLADYLHVAGPAPREDEVLARWRSAHGGRLLHFHAGGCGHCDETGLRGRAGVHELLIVSRTLRQMIQGGAKPAELLQQAIADGMHTLRQDGIDKVWAGVTTIEEVRATTNA